MSPTTEEEASAGAAAPRPARHLTKWHAIAADDVTSQITDR